MNEESFGQWLPIATAPPPQDNMVPFDEAAFLVWVPHYGVAVVFHTRRGYESAWGDPVGHPTHWMRFPKPPVE